MANTQSFLGIEFEHSTDSHASVNGTVIESSSRWEIRKCTAHPTETRPDEEVRTGRKPDGQNGTALGPFVVAVTGDFEHRGRACGSQSFGEAETSCRFRSVIDNGGQRLPSVKS